MEVPIPPHVTFVGDQPWKNRFIIIHSISNLTGLSNHLQTKVFPPHFPSTIYSALEIFWGIYPPLALTMMQEAVVREEKLSTIPTLAWRNVLALVGNNHWIQSKQPFNAIMYKYCTYCSSFPGSFCSHCYYPRKKNINIGMWLQFLPIALCNRKCSELQVTNRMGPKDAVWPRECTIDQEP